MLMRFISVLGALALGTFAIPAAGAPTDPVEMPVAEAPSRERIIRQLGLWDATLVTIQTPHDLTQPWVLTLPLGGELKTITMLPRSLRTPGWQATTVNALGQTVTIDAPAPATFNGSIDGPTGPLEDTIVWAGLVSTGARITIDDGSNRWFVQPVADSIAGAPANLHAIYRTQDLRPLLGHTCGGGIEPDITQTTTRGAPVVTCQRQVEIALEADVPYFRALGSDSAAVIADMESIIAGMNVIYQRDIGVTVVIPSTLVRSVPADPMGQPDSAFEPYTSTAASTLLVQFRDEWNNNQTARARDLAHLFTGRNIDGSTIGIAYRPGVCSGTFAYGLSQSRFSTNFNSRVSLTAHEVGHNFNAVHCDGDTDCAIMCATLGGCTGNTTRFGTRSVNSMRVAANNSCLSNVAPPATPINPRAVNDSASVAAGASVTLDVLSNDFSGMCLPVTISTFPATLPSTATITRSVGTGPNGRDRLIYTAPSGFSGTDTFTYTITDGTRTGTASVSVTSTTPRTPENPSLTRPGLDVAYYVIPANTQVLPNFANLTPYQTDTTLDINFASTTGNFVTSGRADNVAAVWTGYLTVPTTGVYTLFTESDDGSKLFFGNSLVVNNDGVHGMVEASGTANLLAGTHALRVEFFEAGGGAGLIMRWSGPSIAKAVIPAANLVRLRPPCTPSDIAGPNQSIGADGQLTADDIIVFLAWFFAGDSRADIASPNQAIGADGQFTADDIIVFLSRYFAGC